MCMLGFFWCLPSKERGVVKRQLTIPEREREILGHMTGHMLHRDNVMTGTVGISPGAFA